MRYSQRTVLYDDLYAYQTTEYSSWANMMSRCKEKYAESHYYLKNGITVCPEWSSTEGFLNFYRDMGRKPEKSYTIDRIDVTKGYSKENCRWASKSQQAINRRLSNRNTSGYKGVTKSKQTNRWIVVANKTHVGIFKDIEEAALAYDCAAIQFYGSDAKLNILVA